MTAQSAKAKAGRRSIEEKKKKKEEEKEAMKKRRKTAAWRGVGGLSGNDSGAQSRRLAVSLTSMRRNVSHVAYHI